MEITESPTATEWSPKKCVLAPPKKAAVSVEAFSRKRLAFLPGRLLLQWSPYPSAEAA
jgi:hypothetical protein